MDLHGKLLAEGLAKRGHSISVISTKHPAGIGYEKRNGIEIHYLKDTVFGSRRRGWKKESINKFKILHSKSPFALACSQSFAAYGFCSSRNMSPIPILLILHGCIEQELKTFLVSVLRDPVRPQRVVKKFGGLIFSYFIEQRPLLTHSQRIITVSNQVTGHIKKWYGRTIAEKCTTIPNGINTEKFSPSQEHRCEIRAKYGINDSEILLLTLGRITKEKGHHIAIQALRSLKKKGQKAKLMVAGDGNYLSDLKGLAINSGTRNDVLFVGFIENHDTPKYYNACDIFLMPTLTEEGLPFVLLEAMACGLPVISSRIGGIITIIKHQKNGILIEPGNSTQMAHAIWELMNKPAFSGRLGAAALQTIRRNFSADRMVDRTVGVMMSMIK